MQGSTQEVSDAMQQYQGFKANPPMNETHLRLGYSSLQSSGADWPAGRPLAFSTATALVVKLCCCAYEQAPEVSTLQSSLKTCCAQQLWRHTDSLGVRSPIRHM